MLSISDKTLIGFIIVFVSSALWPNSPPFALICSVCCLFVFVAYYRLSAFLSACLFGFLWASASIHYYLDWQIDTHKFNQNVILVGTVASIVHPLTSNTSESTSGVKQHNKTNKQTPRATNTKFNFKVDLIGQDKQIFRPMVRVSWYQPSIALSEGQTLRLFVRLKAPTGLANPDGFNYQTWLASQNIAATAYVKSSPSNRLVVSQASLRQDYINRLLKADADHLPWILALSYGDRSLLGDKDWDLMQNTGTAHLFAISGMHLGIVFGFVFIFLKLLLYIPLKMMSRQYNLQQLLLLSATFACAFYAYIAGLQIPVMRALITVILAVSLSILGLYWRLSSTFLVLLCIFFILFPFAHLGISFWFSFSAVVFIVFFVWRFPINAVKKETLDRHLLPHSYIKKIIYGMRLQVFLSIVTMPIVLSIFGILPLSSLLANMLMIPIVTFILVPLCLISAIIIALSLDVEYLLCLINSVFDWSLFALSCISAWGSIKLPEFSVSAIQLAIVYILLFFVFLPASHYRYKMPLCVIFAISSVFIFYPHALNSSAAQYTRIELNAFDVGQGTAIVIRQETTQHSATMIYDTGASFAGGFSMANAVLMPYFNRHNITDIDYLILSHLDNDHAGGASILQNKLNINVTMTPQNHCYAGKFEQWQSLKIEVLWPLSPKSGDINNESCVLKLSNDHVSILLAGDIEEQAELSMLAHYHDSNRFKADILIAPHHGSQSSSSLAFVAAVQPSYVVFTAGYNNRWGFPHQTVRARYQAINSEILNTGEQGRIRFTIKKDKISVSRYRADEYPRWYFLALAPKTR